MKILKYIAIIIAVLIVGFLLLGLLKPEVSYDSEIVVNKPLAEAWAVTQDEAKMAEWLPGFQKVERVSGTPGTVGAVSDVYFVTDGEEMVIRETITKIVPNETIEMTFTSDFMDMDYKLNMEPMDGKTKITSNTITVGNGILAKSMMALAGSSIKAQEETNLENLKKAIEQNTKDYFPVEQTMKEHEMTPKHEEVN